MLSRILKFKVPFSVSFSITLTRVIEADISAAVVLISMGALLGRTTPIQLLVMSLFEIVVYAANEYFQLELLKVFISLAGFEDAANTHVILPLIWNQFNFDLSQKRLDLCFSLSLESFEN